jgi:hypothetical protein
MIILTAVFVVVFFAIRVGLNDAARSIGSDRRRRRARDRYVERLVREQNRRIGR